MSEQYRLFFAPTDRCHFCSYRKLATWAKTNCCNCCLLSSPLHSVGLPKLRNDCYYTADSHQRFRPGKKSPVFSVPPGRATLLAASRLHYLYLAYFSKPHADRKLYRAVHRHRWHRFLEIGVGQGHRALRMLDVAMRHHPCQNLRYYGIDLFEARPAETPGLTLKETYRLFKSKGIIAQLLPGDPHSALARSANSLRDIDAVVITANQNAESLERAWFYLPRVLHANSIVFLEQTNPTGEILLLALSRGEVEARVRKPGRHAA